MSQIANTLSPQAAADREDARLIARIAADLLITSLKEKACIADRDEIATACAAARRILAQAQAPVAGSTPDADPNAGEAMPIFRG
jgi:hypothetical protein